MVKHLVIMIAFWSFKYNLPILIEKKVHQQSSGTTTHFGVFTIHNVS